MHVEYGQEVDSAQAIIRTVSGVVIQSIGTKPPTSTCSFGAGCMLVREQVSIISRFTRPVGRLHLLCRSALLCGRQYFMWP